MRGEGIAKAGDWIVTRGIGEGRAMAGGRIVTRARRVFEPQRTVARGTWPRYSARLGRRGAAAK